MRFRTKLISSLATLILPFASLAPAASAQMLQFAPTASDASATPMVVLPRGHRHTAVRRRTTKTAAKMQLTAPVFRGPLHTKKVAPITLTPPLVWVNIPTGVYHYPSSTSYGKTPDGKYMTEADAIKEHYRAAFNNQ